MRIQRLKDIYGYTDKQLAKNLNVSISTVQRIRTGKTKNINSKLKRKINSRTYYFKTNIMVRYAVLVDIRFPRRRYVERRWYSTDYTRIQDLERAYMNLIMKLNQSGKSIRILKRNLEKKRLR